MLPRHGLYMAYADYRAFAKASKALGLDFYIYTTGWEGDKKEEYKDAIFAGTLNYKDLMENLGYYDWGLCGNITTTKNWDVAMPNKLFEYMAVGVPIVAMNCKEVQAVVKENDVGICVSTLEELKDRWGEHVQKRVNVIKRRHDFTMESNIYKLEELYEKVLSNE